MTGTTLTWIGDEDASVEVIEQYGHTFPKGEPVLIDAKSDAFKKLEGNPYFSVKKAAEAVRLPEPTVPEPQPDPVQVKQDEPVQSEPAPAPVAEKPAPVTIQRAKPSPRKPAARKVKQG